jgi:hypothetical protein
MDIVMEDRGTLRVEVDGRTIYVGGELIAGETVDFVVYARSVKTWTDGTPLTDEEQAEFLDALVDAGMKCARRYEISWM